MPCPNLKVTMKIYYDKDANLKLLKKRKITVIGYGSQGHAHAHNLHDSGMDVTVGVNKNGASWKKAKKAGLKVADIAAAAQGADLVMVLIPDEHQGDLYRDVLAANLKKGATLAFAHGFNIHFHQIEPRADIDVVMIAPKGPGHLVRSTYVGGGRAGVIATTFREETETDLFGEQVVLCGGLVELVQAGFETLTEAGYAPEMAYFECLHELKLIVDLMYEGGIADMYYSISNTAEYGAIARGPQIIDAKTRQRMRVILEKIRNGEFAKEFVFEGKCNGAMLKRSRSRLRDTELEKVGGKLRSMMPWIAKQKLVDRGKN